jgi:hypothetical protein
MATKTEMAAEIVRLLEDYERLRRDAAAKDARITEQHATIAALEFRQVELVPLPQAVELAGAEYETSRRWCEKGLVVSAQKHGGRWFCKNFRIGLFELMRRVAKDG